MPIRRQSVSVRVELQEFVTNVYDLCPRASFQSSFCIPRHPLPVAVSYGENQRNSLQQAPHRIQKILSSLSES